MLFRSVLSDRQSIAVDAHYGAAQTWDYFAEVHARRGVADDASAMQPRAVERDEGLRVRVALRGEPDRLGRDREVLAERELLAQRRAELALILRDLQRSRRVRVLDHDVRTLADIRDLTLPSDGKAYVLAGSALNRYDVTLGLSTGNWAPRTLASLTAPLSIAWTVPVTTP